MERINAYHRCLETGGIQAFCDQCKAKEKPEECHMKNPIHAEMWAQQKSTFPLSGRIYFSPKPRDGD